MSPEPNFCILELQQKNFYACITKVFKRWVSSYLFLIIWIIRNGNFIFLVKNMLIEFERYSKISCPKKVHPTVHLLHFSNFFQPIEHPVRTNQIPRQIPDQSFYTRPLPGILMGGVLPFGCIFIQLFFILNSIW